MQLQISAIVVKAGKRFVPTNDASGPKADFRLAGHDTATFQIRSVVILPISYGPEFHACGLGAMEMPSPIYQATAPRYASKSTAHAPLAA